jgi:chromosome transmission fidelity protein 18
MKVLTPGGHIEWSRKFLYLVLITSNRLADSYRPIDTLVGFSKTKGTILDTGSSAPVRYAIRQVLDQEYRKETMRKQGEPLLGLSGPGSKASKNKEPNNDGDKENANGSRLKLGLDAAGGKRDFFGRIICNNESAPACTTSNKARQPGHKRNSSGNEHDRKVWVTFHEGFSNAVRKPITIAELLSEL